MLLRVLLGLCLLAAGTCVGMVVTDHRATRDAPGPAAMATPAAGTKAATPAPALAAAPKGAASAGKKSPRPLLWKVSDGDNDVYLLGSFHLLQRGDYPLAKSVDAAFDDAEVLAFEVPPAELTSPDLQMEMMAAAMQPEGGSLQASLDEATWRRLQAYATRRGQPLAMYQAMKAWAVAQVITLSEASSLGYDATQGLDQVMGARALAAHKRTLGLETGSFQISLLDGMSASEQRQFLDDSLDEAEDFKAKMDEIHDRWRNGDAAAMEEHTVTEFKQSYPQLYKRLDVDRNQAWLPKVQAMLDGEHADDAMVVVGCLHLLGPDGLVSQLKSRGYRVERL